MGTEDMDNKDTEALSDLDNQIIRQVEYYFGNYNLGRDKFLREQVKLDDGWVPLETMIKFKRLKSLSDDFAVIVAALKKSPTQLMETSEDGTKIRRSPENPLPENSDTRRDEIDERSLYVKGFKQDTSLDELLDFFKKHKVENITMRRRQNKVFKGSVYITFQTKEDAKTFFELKDIKYNSTELLREYKKDYCKRKELLFEQSLKEKEKKKQNRAEKQEQESEVPELNIVKGCLLKLTGLGKSVTREDIKHVLNAYGTVMYVDYSRGLPQAIVRFEHAVAASVLEKMETEDDVKKIEICSDKITMTAIEGEDEVEYWKNIAKIKCQVRQKYRERNSHRQPWGKGRFNKKNRGKRQTNDRENVDEGPEEPAEKKTKSDISDEANGHVDKAQSDSAVEAKTE